MNALSARSQILLDKALECGMEIAEIRNDGRVIVWMSGAVSSVESAYSLLKSEGLKVYKNGSTMIEIKFF